MRVLCIGAHIDDIELGCGGTLHKYLTPSLFSSSAPIPFMPTWNVWCLVVSSPADPRGHDALVASLTSLGVPASQILPCHLPRLALHESRQEVWQALHSAWKQVEPELVLTHEADANQDHEAVHKESLRTFYGSSILCYNILRSQSAAFHPAYFVQLTEADIAAKYKALQHYRGLTVSEGDRWVTYDGKRYMQEGVVRGQAVLAGAAIEADYAEAFQVVRLIG